MLVNIKCIGWITLVSSALVSLAIATNEPASASLRIAGKPADVLYPFVAEANTNDVDVRSGRGPGYYHCGKLNTGDKVTIIEDSGGWAKVLPLPENYSWIHKNFVEIKPQAPRVGIVKGDNVRVWAGSDFMEPIRSSSLQARLNTGEIVELFDPSQPDSGDYYKIKPPSGAFLWISSEFLRYVGPAVKAVEPAVVPEAPKDERSLEEKLGVTAEQAAAAQAAAQAAQAAQAQKPLEIESPAEPAKPEQPKPQLSKEALLREQSLDMAEKLLTEAKKPLEEQDYSLYKEQLTAITNDPEAGQAAATADALLKRISRYELAMEISQTLKEQDEQLSKTREQIQKAHQAQLKKIPAVNVLSRYTGIVKPSSVYAGITGKKRFLLMDNEGRIQCYLMPAGPEIQDRLEQLIGKETTVEGSIVSDPQTLLTLLSVTSIPPREE